MSPSTPSSPTYVCHPYTLCQDPSTHDIDHNHPRHKSDNARTSLHPQVHSRTNRSSVRRTKNNPYNMAEVSYSYDAHSHDSVSQMYSKVCMYNKVRPHKFHSERCIGLEFPFHSSCRRNRLSF